MFYSSEWTGGGLGLKPGLKLAIMFRPLVFNETSMTKVIIVIIVRKIHDKDLKFIIVMKFIILLKINHFNEINYCHEIESFGWKSSLWYEFIFFMKTQHCDENSSSWKFMNVMKVHYRYVMRINYCVKNKPFWWKFIVS